MDRIVNKRKLLFVCPPPSGGSTDIVKYPPVNIHLLNIHRGITFPFGSLHRGIALQICVLLVTADSVEQCGPRVGQISWVAASAARQPLEHRLPLPFPHLPFLLLLMPGLGLGGSSRLFFWVCFLCWGVCGGGGGGGGVREGKIRRRRGSATDGSGR